MFNWANKTASYGFYDNQHQQKRLEWRNLTLLIAILILVNIGYRWLSIPPDSEWAPHSFVMTPETQQTVSKLWQDDFWRLFLPVDLGGNRYNWSPIMTIVATPLWKIFSPVTVYFIFTSLHVVAFTTVAYALTRSLLFGATLGLMVCLSTFLNYGMVYGAVASLHLFLAFASITVFVSVRFLVSAPLTRPWIVGLIVSWVFIALCFDLWMNMAVSTILSAILIFFWARRDGQDLLKRKAVAMFWVVSGVLFVYLTVRLQFAGQYSTPGHENEMVFSYDHPLLALEDMLVNYFTYLHMSISSLLPGFLSFSPSFTYLGPEVILDGQNGYHGQKTHLVVSSHLTSWRFFAGAYAATIMMFSYKSLMSAFRSSSAIRLVALVLIIITLTGFATYIPIKMRPMNLTPMLGYKTSISSSAFMVLIAWLFYTIPLWAKTSLVRTIVIILIPCSVVLAALTRPAAQNAGLEAVGLDHVSDPFWRFSNPIEEPN